MNAMTKTANEIKALTRLKREAGTLLRQLLTIDEQHALGILTDGATFDFCATLLRDLAKARIESKRISADQRMPLIGERYQKVLARGLAHAMGVTQATPRSLASPELGFAWVSIAKPTLNTAYMIGSVPALTTHEAHPGSRSGVFIIDLRDLGPFASHAGFITLASIAARVEGKAKP